MRPPSNLVVDIVTSLTGNRPFVFMIMSFDEGGQAAFQAVEQVVTTELPGFACIHAGMVPGSGLDLLEKLHVLIARAEVVVAEVSDQRPNVFYEVGFAAALDRPTVMLLRNGREMPSDLRGLEVLQYSLTPDQVRLFRLNFANTLRLRLNKNVALLRDMLEPEIRQPVYILASPKTAPSVHRPRDERTFGDNIGVRGLLSVFGRLMGEDGEYDLISAKDYQFPLDITTRDASLYLIGSPKANDATKVMLDRLQDGKWPKWTFSFAGESHNECVDLCMVDREDAVPQALKAIEGEDYQKTIINDDLGIVIRAPHPDHKRRLVLIMAGRHSLGTGAACLAATNSSLIKQIQDALPDNVNIADKSLAFWALVKGKITDWNDMLTSDGVQVLKAGIYR